ncbi:PGF-CTERM sorting domain-containing protein [Halorubrum sp. JWXQ-INN 858]|nr:PGF-CTERM sorting domain-containing protein [Halorubrum sp. JWXQ-INN 858]
MIAASVSEVEIVEGEETYVIGSLYQAGNVEGTEEIELTATHNETGETHDVGSQEATLSPGYYHLGAINITFQPDETGHYDLELGDRNAGWVDVDESTVEASIIDVDGHSVNFDPDTETEQTYASEDVTVTIEIDADLDLETVDVLVSSLETSYVRSFEASHESGETWTATVSPEDIADDGRYEVSVVAVDQVGTVGTDTEDRTLVIDRDAPRLSSTLVNVDGESATVVVESDKPLVDAPEVEGVFTDPDGSTESDSVSVLPVGGSSTHFTGTFATGETGSYEITSTGTDRAGNEGTDTTSVTVDTRFTLGDGVIEIDDTGTTIEFEVADEADEAVLSQDLFASLSETTANANLDDGQLGVGFITAELDNFLEYYLEQGTVESAEISMAIDGGELPGSASPDEVELHYYDDADGAWEPVAGSAVEIDSNGDPFLTASVSGFSTYGAFVPDAEPPVVDVESPVDGATVESTDGAVTIEFSYDDDRSGIDVGSVTLDVDGEDVTDHDETTITSTRTEHVLTVEPGVSYTATLTVSDDAGNVATEETSFEVESDSGSESDSSAPSSDSGSAGGSGSSDRSDTVDTETEETATPTEPPVPDTPTETPVPDTPGTTPTESTPSSSTDEDAGTDDSIPGFGLLAAVLALLVTAGVAVRTRR